MLEVRHVGIDPTVLRYVEKNRHRLTPDFSSYANRRMRAWLGVEAPLSDSQVFKSAPFGYDSPLWKWLHTLCTGWLDFEPEVALLHVGGADCSDPEDAPLEGRGGQCGIKKHRDAGYGDWRAVGINLCGEATFGYISRPLARVQVKIW